jgi:hypothetical protein
VTTIPNDMRAYLAQFQRDSRTSAWRNVANAEKLTSEPFRGVTADGNVEPGLFALQSTGVSTEPVKAAAEAFLASLDPEARQRAQLPIDDINWRRWNNTHATLLRHGVAIAEMTEAQKQAAFGLMGAGLSARGLEVSRNIMKLNQVLGDITGRWEDFGGELYWVSIFGTPSMTEPWGWQWDGHHLNLNYFVLGDQVVMTPVFMGSEPVHARNGKYAGTRVMLPEQKAGLALFRALNREQQAEAVIMEGLPPELWVGAYRDNFEVRYEGTRVSEFSSTQRDLLLDVLDVYIGYLRPGHAEARLEEVKRYFDKTYFGWIGESEDNDQSVFYYRIHSPVILIEFEHPSASPVRPEVANLLKDGDTLGAGRHTQNHVHTLVRTPNGNDYGMDLLRQHHMRFDHSGGGHTPR